MEGRDSNWSGGVRIGRCIFSATVSENLIGDLILMLQTKGICAYWKISEAAKPGCRMSGCYAELLVVRRRRRDCSDVGSQPVGLGIDLCPVDHVAAACLQP